MGYLIKKNVHNSEQLLLDVGYDESIMCEIWIKSFIAT